MSEQEKCSVCGRQVDDNSDGLGQSCGARHGDGVPRAVIACTTQGIYCLRGLLRRAEAERDAARAEVDSVRSTLIDVLDAGGAPDIESLSTGGVARVFGVCYAAMVGRADAAEAQLARLAEWHPASEPPDNDMYVLVCWSRDSVRRVDFDRFIHGEWETYGSTVTHWRELPPGPATEVQP